MTKLDFATPASDTCYDQGARARADGRAQAENPYPAGSAAGEAWLFGYDDGERAAEPPAAARAAPVAAAAEEQATCPVCARPATITRTFLDDDGEGDGQFGSVPGTMEVATCGLCRSSWVTAPPAAAELRRLHAGARIEPDEEDGAAAGSWPRWDAGAASLIAFARLFTPVRPGLIFLDVEPGAERGNTLGLAAYLLPRPRLACIESGRTVKDRLRAHGQAVFTQPSLDAMAEKFAGKIGIVCAADVLSSYGLAAAKEQLAQIRALLSPTGVLVCSVRAAGTPLLEAEPGHPPAMTSFSEAGLRRLLLASGFDVRLCIATDADGDDQPGLDDEEDDEPRAAPPEGLANRLAAINNGEWIDARAAGVTLKCVATPRRESRAAIAQAYAPE